jgi:hypothetical protein
MLTAIHAVIAYSNGERFAVCMVNSQLNYPLLYFKCFAEVPANYKSTAADAYDWEAPK